MRTSRPARKSRDGRARKAATTLSGFERLEERQLLAILGTGTFNPGISIHNLVISSATPQGNAIFDGESTITVPRGVTNASIWLDGEFNNDRAVPSDHAITLLIDVIGANAQNEVVVTANTPATVPAMERVAPFAETLKVNGLPLGETSLEFVAVRGDRRVAVSFPTPRFLRVVDETAGDTRGPRLSDLELQKGDIKFPNSALPVDVAKTASPDLTVSFADEPFAISENTVTLELIEVIEVVADDDTDFVELVRDRQVFTAAAGTPFFTGTWTPSFDFSPGQRTVLIRGTDANGNPSETDPVTFFVSDVGEPTPGAPNTPVFSELYFIGSTLIESASKGQPVIKVDSPIPKDYTVKIDGSIFVVNDSREIEIQGQRGFELTLSSNLHQDLIGCTDGSECVAEKVAWLRPWQMGLDKTTQTVWFTNEDGHRLGQFDPATGSVEIYDVTVENRGFDPHGVFFDFDSHLTPRVWFVYRNESSSQEVDEPIPTGQVPEQVMRVSYFDLAEKELFTFDFADLQGVTLDFADNDNVLREGHAVFVDAHGHVWMTAEQSHAVIELDFDYRELADGGFTRSGNRNGHHGQVIVHQTPNSFAEGDFLVHGVQTVVDERTGEAYTWMVNEGIRRPPQDENFARTAHVALLKTTETVLLEATNRGSPGLRVTAPVAPGTDVVLNQGGLNEEIVNVVSSAEDDERGGYLLRLDRLLSNDHSPFEKLLGPDQWFEWNIDDGDLQRRAAHLLFTALDDNETPGIPEDDFLVFTDPGFLFTRASSATGLIRILDTREVVAALQAGQSPHGMTSRVNSVQVPKLPGANKNTQFSGPNQAFVDREGTIFAADPQSGVMRLNMDDFTFVPADVPPDPDEPATYFTAAVSAVYDEAPPQTAAIEMTPAPVPGQSLMVTVDDVATSLDPARTDDRSQLAGVDQYEVAAKSIRRPGEGQGTFRGAINAANVLFGTAAQSDHLSTTVFAETARRQMAVVASPMPLPAGARLRGRMAFQVLSDGSLVMTARGDGQLIDEQINLSWLLTEDSGNFNEVVIDGDPSAIVEDDGIVHVFGRDNVGGLIVYKFQPSHGGWDSTDALFDPRNWSTFHLNGPNDGDFLVGEPTTFLYSNGGAAALVTTNEGRVLHYEPIPDSGPTPLGNTEPIYASVGVVEVDNEVSVYGANQKGDLVEISYYAGNLGSAGTRIILDGPKQREHMIFQSVDAVSVGATRHVFAGDGVSRLVHYEIAPHGDVTNVENVSQDIAETLSDNMDGVDVLDNDRAFGYFPFQEPFVARVYTEISVLVDNNGRFFVYGTNGQDLVLFFRATAGSWTAHNLRNDTFSIYGDPDIDNVRPIAAPGGQIVRASRVPGNNVFGAPAAYIEDNGNRHVFQINAEGEVLEYYFLFEGPIPRFHTQNINLLRGNEVTELLGPSIITSSASHSAGNQSLLLADTSYGVRYENELDVNGDGFVSPLDALLVISDLGIESDSASEANTANSDLDINADGDVSPLDALLIISYLNRQTRDAAPQPLTEALLTPVVDAAIDIWAQAGIGAQLAYPLRDVQVRIDNLPGQQLADFADNTVTIDVDAAGAGWFVDQTPHDHETFERGEMGFTARRASTAEGRVDLLTAVLHEFGHILGLTDDLLAGPENLMFPTLTDSVRRLPEDIVDAILSTI